MTPDHEALIRQRAYELWEKQGRPLGLDKEHWERAKSEVVNGNAGPAAKPARKTAAPVKPVVKKVAEPAMAAAAKATPRKKK
jgi:hypothetical protein